MTTALNVSTQFSVAREALLEIYGGVEAKALQASFGHCHTALEDLGQVEVSDDDVQEHLDVIRAVLHKKPGSGEAPWWEELPFLLSPEEKGRYAKAVNEVATYFETLVALQYGHLT